MIKRSGKFFVYMIECNNGTLYTGYTVDLENRLKLHKTGKGAKFLRGKTPLKLVYVKEYAYLRNALKEERRIKTLTKPWKEKLISKGIKIPEFYHDILEEVNL